MMPGVGALEERPVREESSTLGGGFGIPIVPCNGTSWQAARQTLVTHGFLSPVRSEDDLQSGQTITIIGKLSKRTKISRGRPMRQ